MVEPDVELEVESGVNPDLESEAEPNVEHEVESQDVEPKVEP